MRTPRSSGGCTIISPQVGSHSLHSRVLHQIGYIWTLRAVIKWSSIGVLTAKERGAKREPFPAVTRRQARTLL
jgi:hypothetical protein